MTNPLIDWRAPRLIFPEDDQLIHEIRGDWLSSTHPVGQITVLRSFVLPSRPVPTSPSVALLRRPSFWSYASSSHTWARASSPGGVACALTSSEQPPTSSEMPDRSVPVQAPVGHSQEPVAHSQEPVAPSIEPVAHKAVPSGPTVRSKIRSTVRVQGRPVQ